MSKDFTIDLENILTEYTTEITKAVKVETEKAMKELVDETKATAPKNRPKYHKSITSRTAFEDGRKVVKQWYVKPPEHRLTHLLNNGHQTRNGGRVEGTGFLSDAVEKVEKKYIQAVEEAIQNAE